MKRADCAGIPTSVIERKQFNDVPSFSHRVFEAIDRVQPKIVCLSGWLCLLKIPQNYQDRVLNIHPALLPQFGGKGMYGRHVHEVVIASGATQSGCTVHWVNNEYDAGENCPPASVCGDGCRRYRGHLGEAGV